MIPFRSPYIRSRLLAATALAVTDLFATSLVNYAATAQNPIVNGLDLAGQGGMVWEKVRNAANFDHMISDTVRGTAGVVRPSNTGAEVAGGNYYPVPSYQNNGFLPQGGTAGQNLVYWAFRQHPRFLKIVTYTGNGGTQKIPHGLSSAVSVGMVMTFRRDAAADHWVWHRGDGGVYRLNATDASRIDSGVATVYGSNGSVVVNPDSAGVTVGNHPAVNAAGGTYVMYVFAHDTAADGVIQCGLLTNGSPVTLGWKPQWLIGKSVTTAIPWYMTDTPRGWGDSADPYLSANSTNAEATYDMGAPTATGFTTTDAFGTIGNQTIYVAIRAPTPPGIKVDDVFAASLISATPQTVSNGLDNAGQGGLLWLKPRTSAVGHYLMDTARGSGFALQSNTTGAETGATSGFSPLSTGFTTSGLISEGAAWNFRQHSRFLKIVKYTGNGTTQKIPHGLDQSVSVGMVIIKHRAGADGWLVWHRSAPGYYLILNSTNPMTNGFIANHLGNNSNNVDPDMSGVTVGNAAAVNSSGENYVMYVFAHDTASDGVIQCGIAVAGSPVNLGWRPQYLLGKSTTATIGWAVLDTARGWGSGIDAALAPNTTAAEATYEFGAPTNSGFTTTADSFSAAPIYVAIRAPQTSLVDTVFSPTLWTGNGVARSIVNGIDNIGQGGLLWAKDRSNPYDQMIYDTARPIGSPLATNTTAGEIAGNTNLTGFNASGFSINTYGGLNGNNYNFVGWNFRQHPRLLSIVSYIGNGTTQKIAHGLASSVSVGMVVIKRRDVVQPWAVWHRALPTSYGYLNSTQAFSSAGAQTEFGNNSSAVAPDATGVTVGNDPSVNATSGTYIMYVFAHDTASDGMIQCGSFTADGAGAATATLGWAPQYLMSKPSSVSGGWILLDTARGWGAGNDAILVASNTGAEFAADEGAPTSTGFSFIGAAASTNIFMAIRAG